MGLLSYSQLATLAKCGEQLRLEKAGFPQAPAVYLVGGTAAHCATEDYDRHVVEYGEFTSEQQAEEFMRQRWAHHFGEQVDLAAAEEPDFTRWRKAGRVTKETPEKEDLAFWRKHGEDWCVAYAHFMRGSGWAIWTTPEGEPAIELNLSVQDGDVIVRMTIDRILITPYGELMIRDLKSGSRQPDNTRQLETYALGVRRTYGEGSFWGDYFMLRKGTPTPPVPLGENADLPLLSQYQVANKIREQGLYLASPSGMCNSCGVARGCAARGGDLAEKWAGVLPEFPNPRKLDSEVGETNG